jgi:RNA polymerase-binding transcription factor DksA
VSDDTELGGAFDDAALEARREDLQTEAGQLLTQLDDLHVGDPTENHDENFADSGQVAAEQGESMALAVQLREQLDDVQRALDKLDAGTYGQCEACGDPIGSARLEAMPATRYCIAHAG